MNTNETDNDLSIAFDKFLYTQQIIGAFANFIQYKIIGLPISEISAREFITKKTTELFNGLDIKPDDVIELLKERDYTFHSDGVAMN